MANERRLRPLATGGFLEADYTAGDSTLTSSAFAALPVVDTTSHLDLAFNPDGENGKAPFVLRVTAHAANATTVTVQSAAMIGTAVNLTALARESYWTCGPTSFDVEVPLLHVRDEKTQNTAGGTFTSGAWRTRDLNTVKTNEILGASLASNQITLPVGTYEVEGYAPALKVDGHQARLYDTTGAAVLITGTAEYSAAAGYYATTRSLLRGRFALTATSAIELQHRAQITEATDGFGGPANFGTEVFAEVLIRKVWPL